MPGAQIERRVMSEIKIENGLNQEGVDTAVSKENAANKAAPDALPIDSNADKEKIAQGKNWAEDKHLRKNPQFAPMEISTKSSKTNNRSLVSSEKMTEIELQQRQREFLAAATSENTRRAYRSAIRSFQQWGGTLPCDPTIILRYLLTYADKLNPRTLALRLTALSQWHLFQGFNDPTHDAQVRKTLRGINRLHGKPKKKAKALSLEDLERMVSSFSKETKVPKIKLSTIRNNALLQIAFFGAFRRSELIALTTEMLVWEPNGIVITLPRSKTDQEGHGIVKAIPYGIKGGVLCPVSALKHWLDVSNITSGHLFRRITRWGAIGEEALYEGSINTILEECALAADLSYAPQLSSHSFRRGLATSAYRSGASFQDIKRQGGWRHDGTVHSYIEEAGYFEENAALTLLQQQKQKQRN